MNILKLYQNLTFSRKILVYLTSISLFSLILASLAFIIYDTYSIRHLLVQNLLTNTKDVGATSSSALVFHDQAFASKVLRGLEEDPRIGTACLYLENGSLFASYVRGSESCDNYTSYAKRISKYEFHDKHLDIFTPIFFEESKVGTLYIKSSLHELYLRQNRYILIAFAVMALSFIAAFLLSKVFQKIISRPVLELVKTTKII